MHTNSAGWSKTLTKVSYAKIGSFERLGIIIKNFTSRQEMDKEKGRKLQGEYRTRNREILRKKPNNTERAGRGERNAESINKNTEKEIEES